MFPSNLRSPQKFKDRSINRQTLYRQLFKNMALLTKETSVESKEIKNIIGSLVLAFNNDPIVRWMYPLAQQYLNYFPDFLTAFGKNAFDSQTVYYSDNYAGAAFWFPPHVEPNGDLIIETIQKTISVKLQTEVFSLLEQMSELHPSEPHWYLGVLGVDPTRQKQGYGSKLIQDVLDLCDRAELPAYLESSNPINLAFYEKHGFKVIGEIKTNTSPTMSAMIRYPKNS